MHPNVHCSAIYSNQEIEATKMPMEYYSAIKRNEIGSLAVTWMDTDTTIGSKQQGLDLNLGLLGLL